MFQLSPSELIDAKVWINDSPPNGQLIVDSFRCAQLETASRSRKNKRVVIEVLKRLGPRQSYGLLGLLFLSKSDHHLAIKVPAQVRKAVCCDSPLVQTVSDEDVMGDFPEWAIEPVFSTILQYPTITELGPGELTVDYCATGTKSSNVNMFTALTNILIDCLFIVCPLEEVEKALLGVIRHRIA
jgi:hypothetical protein